MLLFTWLLNFLIPNPTPPSNPVNAVPSIPNFNLFNNSASAVPLDLSISVGPPNKSPNVPASSTSATNAASATPPKPAPVPKAFILSLIVASSSNFVSLSALDSLDKSCAGSKYLPAFLPAIATFAKLLPALNAIPPGTPMLIISSVILPAVVASAASSNGFILSKNSSTDAAVLVSAPKSINDAPNENIPSGILNKPDPIPAKVDLIAPIFDSSFVAPACISSNKVPISASFKLQIHHEV